MKPIHPDDRKIANIHDAYLGLSPVERVYEDMRAVAAEMEHPVWVNCTSGSSGQVFHHKPKFYPVMYLTHKELLKRRKNAIR